AILPRAMANMSSISCATTCGRRLPVSARKGSRAVPSATRGGASYPHYAFQAAAISGFTSRITQQLIGKATNLAAAAAKPHNGRDEDQSWVVIDLFGHFRKMASVDQHRDADRQEGRAIRPTIIFVVAMATLTHCISDSTAHPSTPEEAYLTRGS